MLEITTEGARLVTTVFTVSDGVYTLRDSITLPQAEHDALTPQALQAMQSARFTTWLAAMNAAPEA